MSLAKFIADRACPVCAPRTRRKEERPGELLDAALDLFVEKGFAATRAEEVARRAGVSKGTLFLYFSSKEELFKAVVRHNLSGQFPQWNAQVDAWTGSTADMLRELYRSWWAAVGTTKASGIPKLIMAEAGNFPEIAAFYQKEVIEPGNALIRRVLERGVARKEFRPLDMAYAPYSVLAPMIFLMMWKHSMAACMNETLGQQFDPERYLEQQAQNLLAGLCQPDAPAAHTNIGTDPP